MVCRQTQTIWPALHPQTQAPRKPLCPLSFEAADAPDARPCNSFSSQAKPFSISKRKHLPVSTLKFSIICFQMDFSIKFGQLAFGQLRFVHRHFHCFSVSLSLSDAITIFAHCKECGGHFTLFIAATPQNSLTCQTFRRLNRNVLKQFLHILN